MLCFSRPYLVFVLKSIVHCVNRINKIPFSIYNLAFLEHYWDDSFNCSCVWFGLVKTRIILSFVTLYLISSYDYSGPSSEL